MSSWTAASSDCSRPMNNYVHVKTADLYRPNARLTPERQGYQVLTPFGKLGYSRVFRQSHNEDRADVRVVEGRGGLCFLQEPLLGRLVAGQVRREELDGNLAFQTRVVGLPHLAHLALSEQGGDGVAAEGGAW